MSKTVQSGLRTVKRDFSVSSAPSSSSQEIIWPPTQISQPPQLTGIEQRLKAIQDALAEMPAPPQRFNALVESKALNKRPSSDADAAPAFKKPRQLPSSWQEKDPLSAPSLSSKSSSSSQSAIRRKNFTPSSTSTPPVSKGSTAPNSKLKVPAVFLSQEQTQILQMVKDGKSIFYTGSAGTGKSVLLREIIKTLRLKYHKSPDAVAITASTGIAACNIGGVTIHSFAGIGLGIESADVLADKVRKNRKAFSRWSRTQVLIVDEVSMVDGDLFDKLSKIGSSLKKSVMPFGGIQVILTGDFFQLPPVGKNGAQVKFAFEASMWRPTIHHTYNLSKVFRQKDQEFVDMLNEMRFGQLTQRSIAKFRSLSRAIQYEDGLDATELFPRREDVDRSNSTRISRLQTQEELFTASDGGVITDETQRQKTLANFMAPQKLILRVDAQVMLIKNADENLVNGSVGRVVRFVDPAVYGTEFDEVNDEMSFSNSTVIGSGPPVGTAAKKKGVSAGMAKLYPVVEFSLPNGGRRSCLVMPEVWKVELPNAVVQVSRTQLPLILSWAMSIHKSQGQTLERVKVDLGKVFEKGQAYVALSRATSLDGLQVLNFDPKKVQAHPKVAEWSKTLESIAG